MPENAERRAQHERDHATTDPQLRSIAAERVAQAVDRAAEVGKISGVVTIRTKPKEANQ